MKISYKVSGRFGNNLFQYIAAKLIQNEITKKDTFVEYVYNTPLDNAFIVTDKNYFEMFMNKDSVSQMMNDSNYKVLLSDEFNLMMDNSSLMDFSQVDKGFIVNDITQSLKKSFYY